jgi:ssDNA-binding Zn-finger/Zn-ribbon topoisomerase 1
MTKLSSYRLRKWSIAIRARDGFKCYICGKRPKLRSEADAHHIYTKSNYPNRAYDLDNGITVCEDHHQPLVHISENSYKRWIPMFRRYINLVAAKRFNKKYQKKIYGRWKKKNE